MRDQIVVAIDPARNIRELLSGFCVEEAWTKKTPASSREKCCKRDESRWYDCTVEGLV